MSSTAFLLTLIISSAALIMLVTVLANGAGGQRLAAPAGMGGGAAFGGAPAAKPRGKVANPCGGCGRNMLPTWPKCMFCGWLPGASLQFIAGPLSGQLIRLDADVSTIGSVAGNNIIISDPSVSKKHAGIRRSEGGFELADLGSTNGIYVNGHRTPKKLLANGDIVRVGNSEAVFRSDR